MTRDEAKQLIRKAHFDIDNPNKMGELAVDKICADFESRICLSCISYNLDDRQCEKLVSQEAEGNFVSEDFGCNKWKQK